MTKPIITRDVSSSVAAVAVAVVFAVFAVVVVAAAAALTATQKPDSKSAAERSVIGPHINHQRQLADTDIYSMPCSEQIYSCRGTQNLEVSESGSGWSLGRHGPYLK